MSRAHLLVWVAGIAAGCASSSVSSDSESPVAASPRPCTVPPEESDSLWQEVRGAGFTFCVPASWRPQGRAPNASVDPRTWRTASGSITWGTGVPPARRVTVSETVLMRSGDPPPRPTARADVRHDTELLGGRPAEVSEVHYQDLQHTEVRWRDPAVYLQGEARSVATGQILLAIHRTVLFPSEQSPPDGARERSSYPHRGPRARRHVHS